MCQNITFYNDILTFNTHDENEKDVEMGCDQQYAWLRVKINTKPPLPSAFTCRADILRCDKLWMDETKNFNVYMDILSYMKRMKDDDILDIRALQSEIVFFGSGNVQKD